MTDLHSNTLSRDVPMREQIARRAYELYEQRGRQDGRDLEDWLAAEKELWNQNFNRPRPVPMTVQENSARGSRQRQAKARVASASEPSKAFDTSPSLDHHSTQ